MEFYWYVDSPTWKHWRSYFKLSKEEAEERWFWKRFHSDYNFKPIFDVDIQTEILSVNDDKS